MSSVVVAKAGGAKAPPRRSISNPLALILRLVILALLDAGAIWLMYNLLRDGAYALAIVIGAVTLLLNAIYLRSELYPLQWIGPSLALLGVFVIYPIFSTVYTAFTNYGDGHLLTKQMVIRQLEREMYLPEGAPLFEWTAYLSPQGEYLLWLESPETGEKFIARPGKPVEPAEGEPPAEIDGFRQLSRAERLRHTQNLVALEFGQPPRVFRVSERQIGRAAEYEQRYTYDSSQDVLIDNATGKIYRPIRGTFTADDGSTLRPGFRVVIGLDNFQRLLTNPALRGPFVSVFIWTVIFAAASVFITFALGLFLAIMFDVPEMPMRKLLRSLLLIPYAIPAFISVPIWVGLLNPQYGVVSNMIAGIFGSAPPWFSDPFWAKIGILLIQLWLGFPYMFVISTGALQALPSDVYEAAEIDGAGPIQAFWNITLPLLMITMGPLLVASFAFNFNNFVVIELFNRGGPPMSGTISPVGHTDILVTYTYRIAFASGRGADLGYAAAITVAIFLILVIITYFQFRYTHMLEERSENV
ncbi:MAG: maltose ABC transporter permease MalF [Caldilinea sp.]|nr:maltose ABC transporter permease MalF [Caldilinea sp.]MDW8442572.1 maltose ABC transporter permease MalF [Caldilineaceae bacterium]